MADRERKQSSIPASDTLQLFGVLSATWAHSVTNQLGLIRANVALANENIDDKEMVLTCLRRIEESAERPSEIISHARDLSRLSTGSAVESVQVNALIKETLGSYVKRKERIAFEFHSDNDLPLAKGNETGLREVLHNLVDNSIDAVGDREGGKIQITTHLVDDRITIDITDNGGGVPEELVPLIFEIFASGKPNGSGLGLYISKTLLRSWGGDVSLESSTDKGTRMRVVLDRWRSAVTHDAARRALIVDDNSQWRQLLTENIATRGFNVDQASSIEAAVSLIRSQRYDVALLDIRLEQEGANSAGLYEDGLDLARLLHERDPETLVVMLTAHSDATVMREAFKAGVNDFIPKYDFSEKQLYRVLDKLSLRRETERESIRQSQVNKLMYETLSMMSHELRTPLISIKRNAEALGEGALGDLTQKQLQAVNIILASVNREFVMINAHLDLNRIERGAEKLTYREHDLFQLLREEVAVHEEEAKDKRIRLRLNVPDMKALVKVDVDRFRLVLNPLMENAIKFAPENSEVNVSARHARQYIEVQISDDGPGIEPDEIDRLLDMQFSEPTGFSQRMRSSGLGLSVAKRMVSLHKGKLWIDSDGKSGTRVNFRIPVSQ